MAGQTKVDEAMRGEKSRLTLPAQRARETRERILASAYPVFAREGYGEATVDDILAEAGISRGAFYHHFSGKEEVFRALLDDHLRADLDELGTLEPRRSFGELIEQIAGFWLGHIGSHGDFGRLFLEFLSQACREEWARRPVSSFFASGRELIAQILRLFRDAGLIRADLDVESAAILIHATFEGLVVAHTIDPRGTDLRRLEATWSHLLERLLGADLGADVGVLREKLSNLLAQPRIEEERGRDRPRGRGGNE